MMLHDKIMPGQFLLDMKDDCTNYYYHHHQQQQQRLSPPTMDSGVLDLSRRCDSVETRKTPSPYNSTSSFGTASPSTHCGSPPNLVQATKQAPPAPLTVPIAPTPLKANKLFFSQTTTPPLPQGIASLYPLYYPNVKEEIASPPPPPLPLFPRSPAVIPQSAFNNIIPPATYISPKLEDQKCSSPPSLATEATSILYPGILNAATTVGINSGKTTRPFNAYPRDPLLVAAHFAASDVLWDKTTMERYSTYRKRALDDLQNTNGGHRVVTNPKMRRTNHRHSQNSECEERAMESSDNDSSTGSSAENSNKNDSNNNNDNSESMSCSGGVKDEAYFERRRKNNAAAKKSRDRRRIKEDEIAIRAAYLERQNIELLCQIDALKKQLETFTKA